MEDQDYSAVQTEGGGFAEDPSNPMAELLDQGYGEAHFQHGETVEGVIVSVSPSEVLIDVGGKCEGLVTSRDLDRLEPEYRKSLKPGQAVLAYVIRPEDRDGHVILSLARAAVEGDWREAQELFEADEILERTVNGHNKGGLIVNIGRVRGFVPASQVVSVRPPQGASDAEREETFAQLVNKPLRLKIIELDRRRNRLILSERAAVREWRQEQKERLLEELREGEVRRGRVSSLCDFGAFVDLGGADGLVHLSELSWRRVGHPKQLLSVGEEVDVYVLSVDRERKRIALSIKRLEKEPWSTVNERFEVGQLVPGTITKITDFGAFARVDDDIEGLIHISELADERIDHPRNVVEEGQDVTLRIIRIDASKQRLGLSLRRVDDAEYDYDWQEDQELEDQSGPSVDDEED